MFPLGWLDFTVYPDNCGNTLFKYSSLWKQVKNYKSASSWRRYLLSKRATQSNTGSDEMWNRNTPLHLGNILSSKSWFVSPHALIPPSSVTRLFFHPGIQPLSWLPLLQEAQWCFTDGRAAKQTKCQLLHYWWLTCVCVLVSFFFFLFLQVSRLIQSSFTRLNIRFKKESHHLKLNIL